jgi:hypothetical protein
MLVLYWQTIIDFIQPLPLSFQALKVSEKFKVLRPFSLSLEDLVSGECISNHVTYSSRYFDRGLKQKSYIQGMCIKP